MDKVHCKVGLMLLRGRVQLQLLSSAGEEEARRRQPALGRLITLLLLLVPALFQEASFSGAGNEV